MGGAPKLRINWEGEAIEVPLTDQVALILQAGGWLMREHSARIFEQDLGGSNLVSRRLRQISLTAESDTELSQDAPNQSKSSTP